MLSSPPAPPHRPPSLPDRVAGYLSRRPVYHALGWLAFLALLVAAQMRTSDMALAKALVNESINILFYAILVYFNLFYLFPHYLRQGQYWLYLGLLLLATAVITPIKLLLKYLLIHQNSDTVLESLNALFCEYFLGGGFGNSRQNDDRLVPAKPGNPRTGPPNDPV
ncbi:MAG: hypothetical protein HC821_02095 [Lewinella sp.]|nr:hypothetical protein [Lewinella sp.]